MKKFHAIPVIAQNTLLLLLLPLQLSAQVDKIKESNMPFESRQHIVGSLEERYLVSGETNSPFTLFVYLPPTYTDTQRKYPLMIMPINKFHEFLQVKSGGTVKTHSQVFQGENHLSVIPAAFSTAVRFVYK